MTKEEYNTQRALGTLDVKILPSGHPLVFVSFETGDTHTNVQVIFEGTMYELQVVLITNPDDLGLASRQIDMNSVYDKLAEQLF